ncbi:hypothetical protein AMECASPLE_032093 [Ameca splendens]|uniref:Uncharacterized protein n=1 Tax=Ameca splendens TaxID=208324 RepID=A0ABV1ADZ1_9TELE
MGISAEKHLCFCGLPLQLEDYFVRPSGIHLRSKRNYKEFLHRRSHHFSLAYPLVSSTSLLLSSVICVYY